MKRWAPWRRRTPRPDPDPVRPDLLAWAQVLDVLRLSERTVQQIEEYLRTYRRMTEFPREELAFRLVRVIRTEVSPPPPITLPPLDIFGTVLAARRRQLGTG
jgi:hypothetical protein